MSARTLSGVRELLQALLLMFSAVSLATLEFLRNAFPTVDIVLVSKATVVYTILLVQVLPALLLLGADRLIAARDSSGGRLRVFRSLVFAVALLLIVRQLQLYWGPAKDFTDSLNSSSLVLLVVVDLVLLAAIAGLAIGLFRGLVLFFLWMSPVAIAATAIFPSQVPTGGSFQESFGREVVTAAETESQPAVFVLVFDELGYDVLLEDGKLDAESFPNIAALADDGVWFTNATTNDMNSLVVLPTIIDPVKSLAGRFNIRLYTQYRPLEQGYINDCGEVMTCRGVRYLTENDTLRMAGDLALRAFYQATSKPVETAISRPMGWLLNRLGWAYPSVDLRGIHMLTKRQFSVFLDDINGRQALGRIHVLHLFLPHTPLAFNEEGKALSTAVPPFENIPFQPFQPERYRQQSMYVDVLVGELITKLKREGIYDETVIVLTGDHGPRPFVPSPEMPPIQSIPHVPLVIRAPGLASGLSDVDYQHIDFGPTLADILGLPPLNGTVGVSAFSEERPQRDKMFTVDRRTPFIYSPEDDSWHFSQQE